MSQKHQIYTNLLREAQLATSREEARHILKIAHQLDVIENSYQLDSLEIACKWNWKVTAIKVENGIRPLDKASVKTPVHVNGVRRS